MARLIHPSGSNGLQRCLLLVTLSLSLHNPQVRNYPKLISNLDSQLTRLKGGGMLSQAKTQSKVDLGEHVITAGLGIQVLFFGLFIVVAAIFHMRIRAMPSLRSQQLTVPWQSYLFILYTASALIMVRSVFRIAEYVMGQDGFLLRHEYFLYIFDAALMFMSMILFNVWHPSKIIANHHLSKHSRDPESQESSYEITEHSVCASRKP